MKTLFAILVVGALTGCGSTSGHVSLGSDPVLHSSYRSASAAHCDGGYCDWKGPSNAQMAYRGHSRSTYGGTSFWHPGHENGCAVSYRSNGTWAGHCGWGGFGGY